MRQNGVKGGCLRSSYDDVTSSACEAGLALRLRRGDSPILLSNLLDAARHLLRARWWLELARAALYLVILVLVASEHRV